jgi:hypothetical protein
MAESDEPFDFRDIRGMDPAAVWLLGPALEDFLPDPGSMPIPFLIEFGDEEAVRAFNDQPPLRNGANGNGTLVVGFEGDPVQPGAVVPAFASLEWFQRLLDRSETSESFRTADKRITLSSPVPLPPEFLEQFPDFPPNRNK